MTGRSALSEDIKGPGIGRGLVVLMATACGLAAANLYYAQPVLHTLAVDFGTSSGEAGLVPTVSQVGFALGLALVVPLGDLLRRRWLVPLLMLVTASMLVAAAAAPSMAVLVLCSLVIGTGSVVAQLLVPLAASLADDANRGRVVGAVMSGLLLGILLARTVSGLIAGVAGWRSVYLVAAGLTVVMAAVLRWRLPDDGPRPPVRYATLLATAARLLVHEPVLRRRAALGALTFAAFSTFWTTMAFLLGSPPFRYSTTTIGLFGLIGAAGALCANMAGRWADRGGTPVATVAFAILVAGSFVVLWWGRHSLAALIAGIIVLDVGVQGMQVTNQSVIYRLAPAMRSRINSGYMVCYMSGGAIGSLVGAQAFQHRGWSGVCQVGVVVGALSVAAAVAEAHRARRTALPAGVV